MVLNKCKKLINIKIVSKFNIKTMSKQVEQSKYMSWVLRHGLDKLSIKPDSEGYIPLQVLLKTDEKTGLTQESVLSIVKNCPKQRFGIKQVGSEYFIRANQGHSQNIGEKICSDKLLKKLSKPISGVFHGTYKRHLNSIKTTGLNRMSRQHIHLAKGLDAASGKRHDNNLIVYVDMDKAMADGIDFFESANGVILTEGLDGILPAKYLTYAELVNGNPVNL